MGTIGIEWANSYHGRAPDLKNRGDNAEGFAKALNGITRLNFSDDLAWDQDFEHRDIGLPVTGTDQQEVDSVDIAFFSGHGSKFGAFFGRADRDDGTAKPSELLLGNHCNWLIFDCCEVLQDDGAVFDRLLPVFNGLHMILGFHTTAYDRDSRGETFALLLNLGESVRDAWAWACTETEESQTSWAYIRVDDDESTSDTQNDHWFGSFFGGFISTDPVNWTTFAYKRGSC
jgi:Family of unknown function (DUF6345)